MYGSAGEAKGKGEANSLSARLSRSPTPARPIRLKRLRRRPERVSSEHNTQRRPARGTTFQQSEVNDVGHSLEGMLVTATKACLRRKDLRQREERHSLHKFYTQAPLEINHDFSSFVARISTDKHALKHRLRAHCAQS